LILCCGSALRENAAGGVAGAVDIDGHSDRRAAAPPKTAGTL
jgi:hypothetical protein